MARQKSPDKSDDLRKKAEKLSAESGEKVGGICHDENVQELRRELSVYREELRRSQEQLEESRSRYVDLYEYAPVGYLTFDEKGFVLDMNLTAGRLLGVERTFLLNKPLSSLIAPESQGAFHLHKRKVLHSLGTDTCELMMRKNKGEQFFHAQFTSTAVQANGAKIIRTVLIDISDGKQIRKQNAQGSEQGGRDFLSGGGEMGALMRSIDWSKTPLGPVSSWTQALRTTVGLLLRSGFPLILWWGSHFIQFYNDPYRPIPGDKHPASMGQPASECWSEIWHIIGPMIEAPFSGQPATTSDDLFLVIDRKGFMEETHFKVAYSPVPDETVQPTGVGGVLATVAETTEQVYGERQLRTLRELGVGAVEAKTAEDACLRAALTLAKNPLDVPFALFYLLESDGKSARLAAQSGFSGNGFTNAECIDLTGRSSKRGWPLKRIAEKPAVDIIPDLGQRFDEVLPSGYWPDPPHTAIVLPLVSPDQSRPYGILVAGVSPRRELTEGYRTFFELAAGQVTTAIRNAVAYQEERKRAEALAEIDRAKTAFFNNVSHEFRTPLTLMLGPVEDLLVRSYTDLTPAAKGQLEVVNRNGLRLLRLVNTLLDFSRIEAGRVQAIFEPTDLAAFTAELASSFRAATERAGLSLNVDCPKLMEPVYVDRDMWEKIVLNLLSNAFKFTFEGEIEVKIRAESSSVVLSVRDTGVGVPAEEMPRLFERFHRVRNMRSRTHEGSGIGLALVQELVKLHGGSICAESALGTGTTFIVTVPLGSEHLPADRLGGSRSPASAAVGAAPFVEEALRWLPESTQDEETPQPALHHDLIAVPCPSSEADDGAGRARILIADDNADMRQYLVRLLKERYDVEAVADGQAALVAARTHTPDLILSDVMMPRLDGFGLVRELRADSALKTVPIILLSARAGEESRVEGLQEGADDYLIKPFSARELLARVGSHLEMARMRKEAAEQIRESEERFRALYEHSTDGILLTDPRQGGKVLAANPAACTLFGWSEAELMGKTREELFDLNDPAVESLVQRRQSVGLAIGELTYRRKDGSTFPGEVNTALFTNSHGEPRAVSVIRDISDRKKAEEALEKERKQLLALVESLDEAVGVWNTDGSLVLINDTTAKLYGYEMKEQMLKHLSDYADVQVWTMDGRELPQDEWPPSRVLRGETFSNWELEQYIPSINKRFIGSNSGRPVRDANGKIILGVTSVRDITERKRAEESLRASQATLQSFYDSAPFMMGLGEIDGDRTIAVSANRMTATFFNQMAESMPGRLSTELGTPADVERLWLEHLRESQRIGAPVHFEYKDPRGTGKLWLSATVAVIGRSHEGRPLYSFIVEDITERKKAEETLQTREAQMDAFFANSPAVLNLVDDNFCYINTDKLTPTYYGLNRETIKGKCVPDLSRDFMEQTGKVMQHIIETGEPVLNAQYQAPVPGRDGEMAYWITSMFRVPLGNEKWGVGVISLEITERKKAEEALRESEKRFYKVFSTSPNAISISRFGDGYIVDVNEAYLDLFEFSRQEVVGRKSSELGIFNFINEAERRVWLDDIAKGQIHNYEMHYRTKTGRPLQVLLSTVIVTIDNIDYIIATIVDITERKKAEEALRRSEENYRLLFESMVEGYQVVEVLYDEQGKPVDLLTLDINPACSEQSGIPIERAKGRRVSEVLGHLEPAWIERPHEVVSQQKTVRFEEFSAALDRWYSIVAFPLPGKNRLGVITYDVTDRRRAEEALRESRALLQTVMDQLPDAVFLKDAQSRIIVANPATLRIIGKSLDEVIGKDDSEHYADPEVGRAIMENDRRIMESGAAEVVEEVGLTPDGYRTFLSTKVPWQDAEGRVVGLLGITRDITERKRMEEELRKSRDELEQRVGERTKELQKTLETLSIERQRFYDLLDRLPVMTCLLTPDYQVAFANRMFREKFGESEGRRCYEYCYGERTEPCSMCESFRPLETGQPHHWEASSPDGKTIIAAYDVPFTDADGSPMVLEVDIDITEQKQVEEQLRQAHKMEAIGTLAGGIAHDFNNMLAVILGNAELALDDLDGNDGPSRNLDQIVKASKRARDLVRQILTFSRKNEQQQKDQALTPLIQESFNLLRASIPSNIEIKLTVDTESDVARINEAQFQQILVNLCTNAAHAMQENGGLLEISLENDLHFDDSSDFRQRRYLKLSVRDTGAGMDEEVKKRIFDPFFTTKKVGEGTGMGLAVVHGIVEAHNGLITVQSEPGKGSIFNVFLPKTNGSPASETGAPEATITGGEERIMFVDDEDSVADVARTMLERLGYQVSSFTDSEAALNTFAKAPHDFDLIITDQTMPKMTGANLAGKLKAIRPDIPVMLCTGYSHAVSPEKAKKLGIDGYVMKPLAKKELTEAIRKVLDQGGGDVY